MKPLSGAKTKTRIHEAAMALLAETGAERLTVSELATAAGLARGTIYNNLENPSVRVADLAPMLRRQMEAEITQRLEGIEDPLRRIAEILHAHAERAHDEPVWGEFAMRFGYADLEMRNFWIDIPKNELDDAAAKGAISPTPASPGFAAALMGGVCLSMITMIRNGSRSWRQAAFESASLFLRSIGAPPEKIDEASAPREAPASVKRRSSLPKEERK